jgi:DNA polymerase-3 subunit alpha
LPALDLEPAEVAPKEKLAGKGDDGGFLSEHPFRPYVSRVSADGDIVLCGQIDEEMENKVARVAGMVASIRLLTTRDGRASVSAVLEDMDGSVEVVAWPKVYSASKDMWQGVISCWFRAASGQGRRGADCSR